jgi:hypothetical protein
MALTARIRIQMVVAKIGASGDELRTDEVTKIPSIARTSAQPWVGPRAAHRISAAKVSP